MNLRFECVQPNSDAIKVIYDWRNDPVTLAMSMSSKARPWRDYLPYFLETYYAVPSLPPLFIVVDNERVGYILFRPVMHPLNAWQSCADISICIAPKHRQKGMAKTALETLTSWLKTRSVNSVLAQIKAQNEGSIRAFKNAGYQPIGMHDEYAEGKRIPLYRYLLNLHPDCYDRVFIIAEAGSNWKAGSSKEDEERARKLIKAAADAGADAIKFQTFRADRVYAPGAGKSGYLSNAGILSDIEDLFKSLEMPYDLIPKLADWCAREGLEFMSSVFSEEDLEAVNPYVKRHKLASYEMSHLRLIEALAKTGKPLIMSTGASDLDDISWALAAFAQAGGVSASLLQCTAKYPAPTSALHLSVLPMLKARYHVSVGLSDHSTDAVLAPVAAVGLGARIIEKHFTLDRSLPGPDHNFALEPSELSEMVASIRQAEVALGVPEKRVSPEEEELFAFAKRAIQATKTIEPGDILNEGHNMEILRPGTQKRGDHPKFLPVIEGKKAKRRIEAGEGVRFDGVE